jgi:two-component system response regulator HydG
LSAFDSQRRRILIVDDEPASRELVDIILGEEGYETVAVADAATALQRLEAQSFDVVVSDLQMPGMDGLALTQEIKRRHPEVEVLILTAFGSQERAHEAGRLQADYLRKPFDRTDLLHRVARLDEKSRLAREVRELKEALRGRQAASTIIGDSRAIRAVLEQIAATARTDYPVVILGESGTGKELVAQAIHQASHRSRGPFVAVNCGAIPPTLFESEIFGHVRGAFTGAVAMRAGVFEQASGGSLFLDEIGETALEQQVKLLRVLQTSEVKRVGDTRTIQVDVRPIFATNRDLLQMVQEGTFRQDLYYRINVIPIRLPALRERRDDIPTLAAHLLTRANASLARPAPGFTPAALERLAGYSWPGNVRELENKVKQAALLADGREIRPDDIILEAGPASPASSLVDLALPYEDARERFERAYLVECLKRHKGQITKAAEAMRMHRNSLYHLLKKHDLDPSDYR